MAHYSISYGTKTEQRPQLANDSSNVIDNWDKFRRPIAVPNLSLCNN